MSSARIQDLRENLVVMQGETYVHEIACVDEDGEARDLTGYSARMQIRRSARADDVLYDSETDGDFTITGNSVVLTVAAAITAGWAFQFGEYDMELVSPIGRVEKMRWGRVRVRPEVTRES